MSKTTPIVTALVIAAVAAITVAFFLNRALDTDARFDQGQPASEVFYPVSPRPEERILRHHLDDGGAVDQVLMRDGTSKRIVYGPHLLVLQAFAYYKGDKPGQQGPLMYEKKHDISGHLASERHLRLDGSLEMDGHFNPDQTYVRHLYFPASALDASLKPGTLVVSVEQVFDQWWHPTLQTEFRPDSSRKLTHSWGNGLDETFAYFADDGIRVVNEVTTGRGKYYTAIYYPDGLNIKVEALNTYDGTTFQWYHLDHSLALKVTYSVGGEAIVITDAIGKPLVRQYWQKDYNKPSVNGQPPLRLDHLDHFNAEGNVDSRYSYDTLDSNINSVTVFLGDSEDGPRQVYDFDDTGTAVKVHTFSDEYKQDGGKPISKATKRDFSIDKELLKRPTFELPPLKAGLNLTGVPQFMPY